VVLVLVAAIAIAPRATAAADLERTTADAYERYLETLAQAFSKQVGTDDFLAQASPQARFVTARFCSNREAATGSSTCRTG
jgi:hypothetical protein